MDERTYSPEVAQQDFDEVRSCMQKAYSERRARDRTSGLFVRSSSFMELQVLLAPRSRDSFRLREVSGSSFDEKGRFRVSSGVSEGSYLTALHRLLLSKSLGTSEPSSSSGSSSEEKDRSLMFDGNCGVIFRSGLQYQRLTSDGW